MNSQTASWNVAKLLACIRLLLVRESTGICLKSLMLMWTATAVRLPTLQYTYHWLQYHSLYIVTYQTAVEVVQEKNRIVSRNDKSCILEYMYSYTNLFDINWYCVTLKRLMQLCGIFLQYFCLTISVQSRKGEKHLKVENNSIFEEIQFLVYMRNFYVHKQNCKEGIYLKWYLVSTLV